MDFKKLSTKGISLIVLVITIIVIVILAAAIIITLQNSNLLSFASKAKVINDISTFKEEIIMYSQNQYLNNNLNFDSKSLQADSAGLSQNGKTQEGKTIYDVITTLKDSSYDKDEFVIVDGNLVYRGVNGKIQEWAKDAGIIVDKESVNISIISTQGLVIKPGYAIRYNIRMFSSAGIKDITDEKLKSGLKVIDEEGKEIETQPLIVISSEITGTNNDKNVGITIDTTGMKDGIYRLKINANTIENGKGNFNNEVVENNFFIIDSTAPMPPEIVPSTNKWTNQDILVTISIPEEASKVEYSIAGGNWTLYTTPFTITDNCSILARSIDNIGNISAESSLAITIIDKVLPQSAQISATTNGMKLTTTVNMSDNINGGGIDISASKYIISKAPNLYDPDDSMWLGGTAFTSSPQTIEYTVPEPGDYYIQVLSVDKAGNKVTTISNKYTLYIAVTGISLNVTSVNLSLGDVFQLIATVYPENATNKNVIWGSSNNSVATVDSSGKVTIVGSSSDVNITARTSDGGHIATCNISTGYSWTTSLTTVEKNGSSTSISNSDLYSSLVRYNAFKGVGTAHGVYTFTSPILLKAGSCIRVIEGQRYQPDVTILVNGNSVGDVTRGDYGAGNPTKECRVFSYAFTSDTNVRSIEILTSRDCSGLNNGRYPVSNLALWITPAGGKTFLLNNTLRSSSQDCSNWYYLGSYTKSSDDHTYVTVNPDKIYFREDTTRPVFVHFTRPRAIDHIVVNSASSYTTENTLRIMDSSYNSFSSGVSKSTTDSAGTAVFYSSDISSKNWNNITDISISCENTHENIYVPMTIYFKDGTVLILGTNTSRGYIFG